MRTSRRLDTALDALLRAEAQPGNGADGERRSGEDRIAALAAVVGALRPRRADDGAGAGRRIEALAQRLGERPEAAEALRGALVWLLAEKRTLQLFADTGVLANESVFNALRRRISERLLPLVPNPERLRDVLGMIFRPRDYRWVEAAPDDAWLRLLHELRLGELRGSRPARRIAEQVLESLEVISFRIAALGLEPEIVRIRPEVERYQSPFLAQNAEMRRLLKGWYRAQQEGTPAELDPRQLLVLLDQCEETAASIRRRAAVTGASVALTYLLVRLEQNLERARQLIGLFDVKPEVDRNRDRLQLFRRLLRAEARKHSIRDLLSDTVDLLAQRITSHAGRAGEAYMTATRSEYFALLASATGAGLLVALAAVVKTQLLAAPHAPFVEALLFSLNYGWCFVLMSAFHWSLATKQPAMTAHRLAHAMDVTDRHDDPLDRLAELIVRTLRSQFIALVGNFLVVIPLPALIAWWLAHDAGVALLSPSKAEELLAQVDVANPLTWLWGAITGVWLFVAGRVAGYYDNKAVYARIPQRVMQLRPLRWLSPQRRERWAAWLEDNLGAMVGSACFGVLLGSTGALGRVFGLPIDTLHVTFSTAFTAIALALLPLPTAAQWLHLIGGIAVVGTLNLTVSFGLALWVALRSRRVRFRQSWPLLRKLVVRALRTPHEFFFPPPEKTAADRPHPSN